MKITKSYIKKIINEEVERVFNPNQPEILPGEAAGRSLGDGIIDIGYEQIIEPAINNRRGNPGNCLGRKGWEDYERLSDSVMSAHELAMGGKLAPGYDIDTLKQVQARLIMFGLLAPKYLSKKRGKMVSSVDGFCGRATRDAILSFQKNHIKEMQFVADLLRRGVLDHDDHKYADPLRRGSDEIKAAANKERIKQSENRNIKLIDGVVGPVTYVAMELVIEGVGSSNISKKIWNSIQNTGNAERIPRNGLRSVDWQRWMKSAPTLFIGDLVDFAEPAKGDEQLPQG